MGRKATAQRHADIEKFLKLEEDKRNRIVNAAMKEFRYGYKKASTDEIVKDAGISKGFLYHYFGSKEQLYAFTVRHAWDLVYNNFTEMMNQGNQDILAVFWQVALLKKDITDQYPYIYDFINGAFLHRDDADTIEITSIINEEERVAYEKMYDQCDFGLFRDDIDPKKAIDIISCTMDALIASEDDKAISSGQWDSESYEKFLENLKGYMDIFRLCFYR